jgi:hypothetical protein
VAFTPNGMFLYVLYQEIGKLYTIWRRDGQPFQATRFDVKYHETQEILYQINWLSTSTSKLHTLAKLMPRHVLETMARIVNRVS